jgi:fluoride exporter
MKHLAEILLVGGGGLIGSVARYLMQGATYRLIRDPWIPWGTLAVNVLGCFVIGFLSELAQTRQVFGPQLRLFLFIGVLGGFTTFSTFAYETVAFTQSGQWLPFAANAMLHLFLCLGAVWVGAILSHLL